MIRFAIIEIETSDDDLLCSPRCKGATTRNCRVGVNIGYDCSLFGPRQFLDQEDDDNYALLRNTACLASTARASAFIEQPKEPTT